VRHRRVRLGACGNHVSLPFTRASNTQAWELNQVRLHELQHVPIRQGR
jgi:hypothetical protein